jgi:hypothetical protein
MCVLIEVREKSTQTFKVTVTDEFGNAVTPTVATYTLSNRDGDIINNVEDEAITPAEEMWVTVAGDDLELESQANEREYRLLTVETDQGNVNKPENLQVAFWVKNLTVIT